MFSYENLLEAGLRTVSFTAAGLGLTTAGLGAVAYQQWDEVTGFIADGFASFLGTPGSSDETRASTATSHDENEGTDNVAANGEPATAVLNLRLANYFIDHLLKSTRRLTLNRLASSVP